MFKRLFFAMLGLGGGLAMGVWAVRRMERAGRAMAPDALASSLAGRVTAALDAGRAAMAAKEAELRIEHGVGHDAGYGLGGAGEGLAGRTYPGASRLPPD